MLSIKGGAYIHVCQTIAITSEREKQTREHQKWHKWWM